MLVVKEHKQLVLNLRDPDRVTGVIPTARTMQYRGANLVAVPHRLDELRVLRNLGFDVPTPIETYYDWPGQLTPFAHQRVTAGFLSTHPRAYCLSGMGSGKTLATLYAYDWLRRQGKVRRMLVLAPLSTLERAWGDEIFRNFPHLSFAVLHGTREKRHQLLAEDFDIFIINHDGVKTSATAELLAAREGLDVVVVDELASFRNAATARWKALNFIVNGDPKRGIEPKAWAWGLTGTPTPNAPTDAWAQCRLITPASTVRYFGHFRDAVMRQVTKFKWAARPEALDLVRQTMQPAIRFAREDCIDLPPTTYVTRQTELTPEQRKAFDEMLRTLTTEIAGGQITAVNEAVKLGKLMQICCGVAYGPQGEPLHIPATPRIQLTKEIIDESEAKVLVFVPLTSPLQALAKELGRHTSVATVHGGTSKAQRDDIFRKFQQEAEPRVLVANPGTLSHGLTLTAADTVIWFAPINSNETYQQACARVTRPGQTRNTLIVNIEATAIERRVYERLQSKERMQGLLLDLVRELKKV